MCVHACACMCAWVRVCAHMCACLCVKGWVLLLFCSEFIISPDTEAGSIWGGYKPVIFQVWTLLQTLKNDSSFSIQWQCAMPSFPWPNNGLSLSILPPQLYPPIAHQALSHIHLISPLVQSVWRRALTWKAVCPFPQMLTNPLSSSITLCLAQFFSIRSLLCFKCRMSPRFLKKL